MNLTMGNEATTVIGSSAHFRRSIFVLVGGTALGHLITALALPLATRLYSPDDFSVLAVFVSLASIISVIACLRFDAAVPLADGDEDASTVLLLALGCALIVSTILGTLIAITPHGILEHNTRGLTPYLWLLPLVVFLMAVYNALQGWFVRKNVFGLIARGRLGQSIAGVVGQVGLGFVGVAPLGLLVGYILNAAVGTVILGSRLLMRDAVLFRGITRQSLKTTFTAYKRFPKYSTFEALCNSASIQLPIIMIASIAIGPEAGYLTLAMYVMQAPMLLIGNAVGQVYLAGAPEAYRRGNLAKFTVEALGRLSKIGVGPLIFSAIVAPEGFAIVFGEDWRRAGEMVTWMTPWFIAQFLTSPLSMAIHVTSHQRAALILQIYGLLIRVLPVWGMSLWSKSFIVEVYALTGLLFYASYLIVVIMVIHASFKDVIRTLYQSLWLSFLWGGAGLLALSVTRTIRHFINV